MYSNIVNGLGISQNTLEVMVFAIIGIIVFGVILMLYWKFIVVGAMALSCVVVLANHKTPEPAVTPVVAPIVEKKPEPVVEKKEEVINEVKPDMTQPPTKDAYKLFMDDCMDLADYSKSQCDNLWRDRVQEERAILEETKLKGKHRGRYQKA